MRRTYDINKPDHVPKHQHGYRGGRRGDINVPLINSHDQKDKRREKIWVCLPHRPP